ncbi:CsbD family protein [Bdellovibrio sp. SKB1291214]|uniref:CsbD family protein n=1 Tax=Bdellovibrio sp. SKB1291214 TaxID=1732569 RepID=UPI000B51869F|nr:CsbD family protein [Bdellovibrio sp. SKB1291214]UYL09349.1 CsbD family protein [Bdellovibrio sp. SKB1291214]
MNKDTIQGKWNEIKGELRKTWGNITDDEFEKTKGDAQAIAGIVQQRYGLAKEDASEKVSTLMSRYAEATKETLRQGRDEAERKRNH